MLVACLQLPYPLDVAERISLCESMLAKEEFDLLVLPAVWVDELTFGHDSMVIAQSAASAGKLRRYLCELSARKHATVVAGIIESVRQSVFQCAIVVSHGALVGRYVKCNLSKTELEFFRPGRVQYVSPYGAHYSLGVVSDSDLRCEPYYLPLQAPRVNIGVVVGASSDPAMHDRVQWRAKECGVTLVYANICPPSGSGGRSGIVSPLGNWLAVAADTPAFVQCELPSAVVAYDGAFFPWPMPRQKYSDFGKEHGFDEPPRSAWWW